MAQQVDPKLAAACVDRYQSIYIGEDLQQIKDAYTSSISFSVGELNSLLKGRSDSEIIKIMPGVYTEEFANAYGTKAGRMSIFLYPDPPVKAMDGDDLPPDPTNPKNDPLDMGNQVP